MERECIRHITKAVRRDTAAGAVAFANLSEQIDTMPNQPEWGNLLRKFVRNRRKIRHGCAFMKQHMKFQSQ